MMIILMCAQSLLCECILDGEGMSIIMMITNSIYSWWWWSWWASSMRWGRGQWSFITIFALTECEAESTSEDDFRWSVCEGLRGVANHSSQLWGEKKELLSLFCCFCHYLYLIFYSLMMFIMMMMILLLVLMLELLLLPSPPPPAYFPVPRSLGKREKYLSDGIFDAAIFRFMSKKKREKTRIRGRLWSIDEEFLLESAPH